MSELTDYINTFSERNACRCGRCLVSGEDKSLAGHTANMVFFDVAAKGEPTREGFIAALKSHRGEFCEVDPLDGNEHNYLELGGWVGDQGAALQLMGLGSLLKAWDLLTPYTIFGPHTPNGLAQQMASAGLVAIRAERSA